MSARASATRYARALLDVAIKESDPDKIGADLSGFADLIAAHPDLRDALTNPVVPAAAKQRVVNELVTRQGLQGPVSRLVLMLAERDRMALLPEVLEIYRERLLEHQGVLQAEVTAATEISTERAGQLQQRLAKATGRKVTLTTRVDPALIGGAVTRIGSTIYDGSVATQLEQLRAKLLQDSGIRDQGSAKA
jgi:F-type H+-transporting ATPase subunit delta